MTPIAITRPVRGSWRTWIRAWLLPVTCFVAGGVVSALAWAGAWLGLGYLLSDAIADVATTYGIRLGGFALCALMIGLVVRRARRCALLRALQRPRISPRELYSRMERGERLLVLDTRPAVEVALEPVRLPGAVWMDPADPEPRLREVPRDLTVVLYGKRSECTRGDRILAHCRLGGLEADLRVRAVAERFVGRAAAAAERERRFAGQVIDLSVRIDELDAALECFHAIGPVQTHRDSYRSHRHLPSLTPSAW